MKKHSNHALSEQLAQARKKLGLSQTKFGEKVGLTQSHISKLEKGLMDPRTSNLVEMARLLGFEVMLVPKQIMPVVKILMKNDNKATIERSLPASLLDDSDL